MKKESRKPRNSRYEANYFRIKRRYLLSLAVFAFFFICYLTFLTNDHFIVDGATRPLEVYWGDKLILHGNNHILYPFNVYVWDRLVSLFLGEANSPYIFIRRTQVMTALASSIILALSYLIYLGLLREERLSLVLVISFGFSNAFFSHSISSAEPIVGFLFFVLSFYLITCSLDSKKRSPAIFLASSFLFAYSIMSYLAMAFGLPFILTYLYYKTGSRKKVIGYFLLFLLLFSILFFISSYYKGVSLSNLGSALGGNKFSDRSHTGFKLKNIPQYPFGMINAFYHINEVYDLPSYLSSLERMDINSIFSVVFGVILGAIIVILLLWDGFFEDIKGFFAKRKLSVFVVSLTYFLSASAVLILFLPVYDKLWIMGLHSFLLFFGVVYTKSKRTAAVKSLFIVAVLIMLNFNISFAIKSKNTLSTNDCVEGSLKAMGDRYFLLGTWGGEYGKYFTSFYYNNKSRYYRIPNLAVDNSLDSGKVVAFLKNELCNSEEPFYVDSDVLMSEKNWNTFLGDEMKMDYTMFHKELLDHVNKVTECVYELDRANIC